MNIVEALQWLDENNAFTDDTRKSLTSGITRKLKNRDNIFKEFTTLTGVTSDDPAEIIYNIVNPNCSKVCEVCGKPTSFDKFYNGYKKACCKECSNKLTVSKGAKTKEEKYGSATYNNPEKNRETLIRNHGASNYRNVEKAKQTKLERYGNPNYNNLSKYKLSCKARWGVDNPMKVDSVKASIRQNNLKKYGVEWASQIKSARDKQRQNKQDRFLKSIYEENLFGDDIEVMFSPEDYLKNGRNFNYKYKCKKCGEEFTWNLIKTSSKPYCKACNPSEVSPFSKEELELFDFLRSIYNGPIYHNDRKLIAPLEVDFYLPEKNVAIEYNGLYWHSEIWKDKNYHLNKTKMCEAKGVRLIHIFEDEWVEKRNLIESIIRASLGIFDRSIGARKCVVREVSKEDSKVFLNENHLQGYVYAKYSYGLYYKEELVSLLTFNSPRYSKDYDYELLRFVNKKECNIIGGFSKLLKAFRKEHLGSILTYSDRRLFSGNVYRNNGFSELTPTNPDYWYVNFRENKGRESRLRFQKKKLLERFGESLSNLTEKEIANSKGYYQIYGCGNWKFILN